MIRPLLLTAAISLPVLALAEATPPGFNVHQVEETGGRRILRGGAPRQDTLNSLAASARRRGVKVTLVDLRSPPNSDDRSGKGGRLSPQAEAAAARKMGLNYLQVSALDKSLIEKIQQAHRQGDVYFHCMYGVNRTGFAAGRLAVATGASHPQKGTGKRDWSQGVAFEKARRRR